MKINEPRVKKSSDVSKELEIINFRELHETPQVSYLKQDFKSWVINEKGKDIGNDDKTQMIEYTKDNKICIDKTQFISFQKAMKFMLAVGMLIGLHPVAGIFGKDVSKMRFTVFSFKLLYTAILTIFQSVGLGFCFNRLFTASVSIRSLAYVSFYLTTWSTTIIFIWISTKWSILVKEIFNCNLDEYVDSVIVKKIKITCIVSLFLAILEHAFALLARTINSIDCSVISQEQDFYGNMIKSSFPWLFELGIPYSVPLGIVLLLMNIILTIIWSYSDMFIICMSQYLTSVLNQINKKIIWAADKAYLSPSVWSALREDYTRATRLVRLFDEIFSGLILVSFASNLFFTCLQLFNILVNGVHARQIQKCPYYDAGPLHGYENTVYLAYSLAFIFARFLSVSLIAAGVNVASLVPAPAIYRVPSCAYSKEVQRFLEQVLGTVTALSGLNFFYINRDLVLSVAATIVTYELVLLQFSSTELNNNN